MIHTIWNKHTREQELVLGQLIGRPFEEQQPVPRASFLDRESVGLSFGEPARRTPVTPSGSLPEEHPATTGRSQMELTSKWELTSPKSPPTSSSPLMFDTPFQL
ncbi:histone H2B type 2-F isoform 2-T10 [Callospermophilus lateralis]|uniref:histone H2B type 2-F isoform X2 n=1 Tax=Callospermophilus lateralis TaxID=76772 RepID=UPI00403894C0